MVKGLQSPGVGAFFLVFVLLVRTAAANPIVKIAPYEPVIIEVPMAKGTTKALQSHPLPQLPVLLRTSEGRTKSFVVPSAGMLGMKASPDGSEFALWLITNPIQPREDLFVSSGMYQVQAETTPPTVVAVKVAEPSPEEVQVAAFLKGNLLTSISLIANGTEVNSATKAVCEQVLEHAPFSPYADYANAYLAVHRYYASQHALDPESLIGKAAPDVASNAKDLVGDLRGLEPVSWPLRGMVLYYRGYGQATAGYTKGAVPTLETLAKELMNSPWSRSTKTLLAQIDREKVTKPQEEAFVTNEPATPAQFAAPEPATASATRSTNEAVKPSERDRRALKWGLISLCLVAVIIGTLVILRRRQL